MTAPVSFGETDLAAVYTHRLNGHRTASGKTYHANQLTAAHKTLPFGTEVKVTNERNHKSVVVRITNRGPVQEGRILDISTAAAKRLRMGPKSLTKVSAEVVAK